MMKNWTVCGLVLIYLILLILIYIFSVRSKTDLLVVLYETSFENPRLKKYIKTLNQFDYTYKLIGDFEWKGFGKKIKTLEQFLNTLPPQLIVVISDARDVFVGKNKDKLISEYERLAKNKVLVSTEWACCEKPRTIFSPNNIRYLNGMAKYTHDDSEKKITQWVERFRELAFRKTKKQLKWVNPNAGLYMGKVKDILKMYRLMNIVDDKEDDQSVLSEIILQNPNMFELDYFASIFSNSHIWGGSCHYTRSRNKITNTTFNSEPFFFHFPAKHFSCYDNVYNMLSIE